MSLYTVAAFYKFIKLTNTSALQKTLQDICADREIMGTILLAEEGLNGTISGQTESIQAMIAFLRSDSRFSDLDVKYSSAESSPFHKTKIVIKPEIIAFTAPGIDPGEKTGVHVTPSEWNDLISDPEVLLLDTRNDYEIEHGTFKGAINPHTGKFSDFKDFAQKQLDPKQHKKIAMFCTGGIRCEKASAYLLQQGFENIYQLQGGILKYLEQIEEPDSLWEGKCFIFDDRLIVEPEAINTTESYSLKQEK